VYHLFVKIKETGSLREKRNAKEYIPKIKQKLIKYIKQYLFLFRILYRHLKKFGTTLISFKIQSVFILINFKKTTRKFHNLSPEKY